MTDDSQENPIDVLAEDFVARYRLGERPSLTEYVVRHPEMAEEIRGLFPTLIMMEQARSQDGSHSDRQTLSEPFRKRDAPQQLGEFQILREVGRGGMGIVYEAVQESLGRHVALKILPMQLLQNPTHLQRFQREVRAAARLHHPNIVPVFGAGDVDGVHYYAMQFIQGLALDQVAAEVKRLRSEKSSILSGHATPVVATDRNSAREQHVEHSDELPIGDLRTGQHSAANLAERLMSGVFQRAEPAAAPAARECNETVRMKVPAEPDPGDILPPNLSANPVRQNNESRLSQESLVSGTVQETGRAYWNSVARIGIQVAEALQYAADHGVQHRDIKPANLLLDLTGTVWVTDFGLAKSDDSDELTNTGDIVGTLRYLAPERLSGESELRSDIYSLGATLYELLVLKPLFDGVQRGQLLSVIAEMEPVRPRLIDGTIPPDLETIVLKAMSKDMLDRYASATSLAEDLRRFLEDRPVLARRIRTTERLWRWCRRNRMLAGFVATSGVLSLVLLASLLIGQAIRHERDVAVLNEERAEIARLDANRQRRRAEAAERESRIRAHLAQAAVFQQSGSEGQRFNCLNELQHAAKLQPGEALFEQLRDSAVSAMGLTDIRPAVTRSLDFPGRFCFDHQLQHFAFIELHDDKGVSPGSLTVRRIQDDAIVFSRPRPDFSFWHAEMAFSPDDRFLMIHYRSHSGDVEPLYIWDLSTDELAGSLAVCSMDYSLTAAVHPDGRTLIFPASESELVVWDLIDRRELRRTPIPSQIVSACFDATGSTLAINQANLRDIVLMDFHTGAEVGRLEAEDGDSAIPSLISWSTDGELLAVGRTDGTVAVWNIPQRQQTSVLTGHSGRIIRCEFARGRHLLMTHSWDNTSRLWNAAAGQCLLTTERRLETLSADSRSIGFVTGEQYGICELSHEAEIRLLHDPAQGNQTAASEQSGIYWAQFSADERILATYGNHGVDLWDLEHGRKLERLPVGNCYGVLFHPDGTELLTSSDHGIYHWPLRTDEAGTGTQLHCGPPEKISPELNIVPVDVCWLPGHTRFAVNDRQNQNIVILDSRPNPDSKNVMQLASSHGSVSNIAVSPDGRWLAASAHRMRDVQIWDLETGKKITVPDGDGKLDVSFAVTFSPDGRWLVTSETADAAANGYYFFDTGTWRRHRFDHVRGPVGRPAFSSDGRLFASSSAPFEVVIAESLSGRQVARIHMPNDRINSPIGLLGENSVLAIAQGGDVVLWNLAAISRGLETIGLPWDQSLQAISKTTSPGEVLKIIVNEGTLPQELETASRLQQTKAKVAEGQRLAAAGRFEESAAAFSAAIVLSPEDALALNNFAWMLVTRPDHNAGHARQSVELAQRAVQSAADEAAYWNTCGVAQYRDGQFRESIASLEKSEVLQPREFFASNAYFLAMAHWKLGETELARRWFEEAVIEHDAKNPADKELAEFRLEAESLLNPP